MLDLYPYANYEEKLPSELLYQEEAKPTNTWPIVASHFIDFFVTVAISSLITTICNQMIKMFLVIDNLQRAYAKHEVNVYQILPLVALSYFFFSYFFNDGQTYGMHTFKKRMHVKTKSFRDAFKFAAHSTLLCWSWGLSYFFTKSIWENVKAHDHLYGDLLAHRDVKTIDLLARIEKTEEVTEELSRAA